MEERLGSADGDTDIKSKISKQVSRMREQLDVSPFLQSRIPLVEKFTGHRRIGYQNIPGAVYGRTQHEARSHQVATG